MHVIIRFDFQLTGKFYSTTRSSTSIIKQGPLCYRTYWELYASNSLSPFYTQVLFSNIKNMYRRGYLIDAIDTYVKMGYCI